jgi:hypothetical protein
MGTVRWQEYDKDGYRHVEEIHKVVVHKFSMGDVDDPDLYVAQPIYEWQESDAGKFIMEHAVEKPYWHRTNDIASYGHRYDIVARLSEQNETFWILKWGNK